VVPGVGGADHIGRRHRHRAFYRSIVGTGGRLAAKPVCAI
jgi:hypothetical protein